MIYIILLSIVIFIILYIGMSTYHRDQIGHITVSNHGSLEVHLKRHPDKVDIYFCDDSVEIPCNPANSDKIEWELKHLHSNKPILMIKWNVVGVREIEWIIKY